MWKVLMWLNLYCLSDICSKTGKNAFFVFLGHFCAYFRQSHDHKGWATSMPFTTINPTKPRTNPWIFWKKILRIGGIENPILESFLQKKILCFIPMKIRQSVLSSKDGSKFWWLPWPSAQNNSCVNICNTV